MKTKKLLLTALAIVLVGGGCLGSGDNDNNEPAEVVGDWVLAFDLPEGWVMVNDYGVDIIDLDGEITNETPDVTLQSTSKTIELGEELNFSRQDLTDDELARDDFSYIRAYKLSPRYVVPDEVEDLGDGFFRERVCAEGEECSDYGKADYEYYFIGENARVKFVIYQNGQELEAAEAVVLSAQETTTSEAAE